MAHHVLQTPITEAQARGLRVNDTVTLEGTLFGIRESFGLTSVLRARHEGAWGNRLRATLSFDTWLTVKVWGMSVVSFLFAIANMPMLLKHGLATGEEPEVDARPHHRQADLIAADIAAAS